MAVSDSGGPKRLPLVEEAGRNYEHPLYSTLESVPGLSVGLASVDQLLTWGLAHALWVFPMATSCCGIELMAAAASRVDLDRMGTIVRATPRQADVMVIAGTITVKMAPRVKKLWDQMPEPKWAIAMGSCAISGDFYRELYSVIPGIDTVLPVDVYVPGCPPNPESLMAGLLRLQQKVKDVRAGRFESRELNPSKLALTNPSVPRVIDPTRDPNTERAQIAVALSMTDADVAAVQLIEEQAKAAAGGSEPAPAPEATPLEAASGEPAVHHEGSPADVTEDIFAALREHGVTELPKDGPPLVAREQHLALARRLVGIGYRSLTFIVSTHFPAGRSRAGATKDAPEHFEVAYGLRKLGKESRVASWSVKLAPGEGVPSLVGLVAGADWQEREQWDLVGTPFDGHPDLRRLMMPEGWDGHPLRRDYPADKHTAPWR